VAEEIVEALRFILTRMTWRGAAGRLGVTTPALHRWVRGGDPTWSHGKAILALAESLREEGR